GIAFFPEDGQDAEELLAEADRRMYFEKQQQPAHSNRRLHPRMRSRLTVELQPSGEDAPVLANLTDLSLGGCYAETSAILTVGTRLKILFSIDNGTLQTEGAVVRLHPGSGV